MDRTRTSLENPCIFLRAATLGVLAVLCASTGAPAVEVEPGQLYEEGTRLEASDLGVAFTIPQGWRGTLPNGSEVFVLQPVADPTVYILAMGEEATPDELASTMAAPIPLGNGLSLYPTGAVGKRDKALTGRYEVRGAPNPLVAYAEALTGPSSISVAYILIAAPALLSTHEPTVRALVASTSLGAPASVVSGTGGTGGTGAAAGGGAGGKAGSGSADRWDAYLKGKYIVRYYTASGYTDEEHLWLCSDGSFQRRAASGGFGGGASGAFQGDSTGRWTATGAGGHGALTLHYGDGSQGQYQLRWDYQENHLYVDGKRWLHGDNDVCN